MPFARRGEVRLFYTDTGAGPPVLLHTGGCGDGNMWAQGGYVGALEREHRVLAMDHRGHGRSDRPTDAAAHELREYAADVVAVLDAAGVDRAALVGYSFGCRVALAVAAAHPARITAVAGLGTLLPRDFDPSLRLEDSAEIRERGTRAVISEMAAAEAEVPPRWFVENLCATDTEMFALLIAGLARDVGGEWGDLERVRCPVLIVWGEREQAVEPTAQVVVLPGLGHLQVFYRSELTLPHLLAFLAAASV
jgi:pimeloyl-ACP methyl ester carboxylesterase